jgi:hypothetical protein
VSVETTHATARARREGCGSAGQPHPVVFVTCPPNSPG